MSIVTYENVDTPVFEIDFIRYLFANGEQGALWGPLPYYSDAAGTVEADWGDPVGNIPDASGNGNDWTQVTSTARPILRNSPPRLEFDGTDDTVTTTLPAISGGTIVLAGTNGIWIDELDFAGGEFSVGPDTYTGGPAGLMSILGDLLVEGGFVIDRALTPREIAKVKGYYKARGSAGLIELGPELIVNGDFSAGLDGWSETAPGWELGAGVVQRGALGYASAIHQSASEPSGGSFLSKLTVVNVESGGVRVDIIGTPNVNGIIRNTAGYFSQILPGTSAPTSFRLYAQPSFSGAVTGVSVRRLIMHGETP